MSPTSAAATAPVTAGGFTRFRRIAETPFNLIYEARLRGGSDVIGADLMRKAKSAHRAV
jgi:hypothetical protein